MSVGKGIFGGPMAEPASSGTFRSARNKEGAHYNLFEITGGMASLREIFPEGQADELNFALFSTSGIHGSYVTIEEIESGLENYGDDPSFERGQPDDYYGNELTVVIVQPRLCCLRYGNITVSLSDIPYLKQLRETSWAAIPKIGTPRGAWMRKVGPAAVVALSGLLYLTALGLIVFIFFVVGG